MGDQIAADACFHTYQRRKCFFNFEYDFIRVIYPKDVVRIGAYAFKKKKGTEQNC